MNNTNKKEYAKIIEIKKNFLLDHTQQYVDACDLYDKCIIKGGMTRDISELPSKLSGKIRKFLATLDQKVIRDVLAEIKKVSATAMDNIMAKDSETSLKGKKQQRCCEILVGFINPFRQSKEKEAIK